jgi:histidine triad (HIT) family protein
VDTADFCGGEGIGAALWVDAGAKERFVDVDVAEAADQPLVEQDGLDLAGAAAQALLKPLRGELLFQRLTSKALLQARQLVVLKVGDAAELALVGEAQVEVAVELDGQSLEAERGLGAWYGTQLAGHAQVNDDGRPIVKFDNQVLGTAPDLGDFAPLDACQDILGAVATEHAREVGEAQGEDVPADDLVDQGAANGFDLGEFWHTRVAIGSPERGEQRSRERTTALIQGEFPARERMADTQATDCIFCRIARGELGTEFVAESEHNVAFRDLQPQAPVHILVVPRRHFTSLREVGAEDQHVTADALALASRVAEERGLYDGGYRVITNDGPDAGQTVWHLHFHVLGGAKLQAGLG